MASPKSRSRLRRPHPIEFCSSHKPVIGRAVVVFCVAVCLIVPLFFVNNAISYSLFFAAVLTVLISYAYLQVLRRSLEFSEDSLLDSCERGREIEFVVTFRNKSPLLFPRITPYFYINDLFGNAMADIPATMPLMPKETRDFRFKACFKHIGTYSAGVSKIVISDPIGLFSKTLVNTGEHQVSVLPRLFDIERAEIDNVSAKESRKAFQPIVTDDMDYAGVREYVWGDPLKTIHWKLSARDANGDYFTRLFEAFGNPGITIIMDTSAPAYDSESLMQVFDGVVESALSLNEYARTKGVDSELMYIDRYGEPVKTFIAGVDGSSSLIEGIPRIQVSDGREHFELLQSESRSIHAQGNIAYCTPQVNDEVLTALCEIKLHKKNPLLFVVVPADMPQEERDEFLRPLRRLDAAAITYYVVSAEVQLDQGGDDLG